jgi:hypothetical protein
VRISLFLGVLALGLASAALFLNDSLSDLLREQMVRFDLNHVLAFEHVSVTSKQKVLVLNATIEDPETERVVASVDQLEIGLKIPWTGGLPVPEVQSIRGRGGRVLLRYEEGELSFVRGLMALLDGIGALMSTSSEPTTSTESELPELYFEDLEVVVYSEGLHLQRYPSTSIRVREQDSQILEVMIATGADGGTLQLLLDDDGLTRLTADQFHVSPAVTTLDPAGQDILMRGFSPTGDLDAVVDLKTGLVSGTLFNAYIDAAHVPFPLGPATIPFQVDENNVLRIDEAKLAFNGGDVVLSLEAGEHEAFMSIDVDGAEFKEEILHLIPGYQEWEEVDVADGGSFECHLKVSLTDNMSEVSVVGGGGFYVSAVDFTKHGVQLEDVVGRFEVNEQNVLKFPEISARTLGGRFRTSGTLGLLDEEFRIELSLEDLDVAQLHDVFLTTEEHEDDVAGWLQGSIQGSGQLQDPASYVAKGQASVRAGNFWDTPTFEQILKVLTMSSNLDGHQRVDAEFTVGEKLVNFDSLEIQSDVLTLSGSGSIRFNGRIRFELRPAPVRLGMVGKLLDTLKEELLVKLTVRGTLGDPRVSATPLNIVARPFRSFWNFLFEDSSEPQSQEESPADEAASDG